MYDKKLMYFRKNYSIGCVRPIMKKKILNDVSSGKLIYGTGQNLSVHEEADPSVYDSRLSHLHLRLLTGGI